MQENQLKKLLKTYGPDHVLAYVRWAPTAYSSANNQALTEAMGVSSVRQTAAGTFTINFAVKPKAIIPLSAEAIDNGTTVYNFTRVESTSASAGTAAVTHKSVAFANVASGPSASDTVDELCFAFLLRIAN